MRLERPPHSVFTLACGTSDGNDVFLLFLLLLSFARNVTSQEFQFWHSSTSGCYGRIYDITNSCLFFPRQEQHRDGGDKNWLRPVALVVQRKRFQVTRATEIASLLSRLVALVVSVNGSLQVSLNGVVVIYWATYSVSTSWVTLLLGFFFFFFFFSHWWRITFSGSERGVLAATRLSLLELSTCGIEGWVQSVHA